MYSLHDNATYILMYKYRGLKQNWKTEKFLNSSWNLKTKNKNTTKIDPPNI